VRRRWGKVVFDLALWWRVRGRRTWQWRWHRWGWGLKWGAVIAAIFGGLGWVGVWDAVGAAITRTVETFQSFTAADLDTLYVGKRVEAFRNLLWGLSVAAGAVVAMVTLGLSGWRTWTEGRRADTERRKLETETFSTAIEQLGNKDFAIRLGAILNLETLADSSLRLHQPIIEAFCAYLREKTKTPPPLLKEAVTGTDAEAPEEGEAIRRRVEEQTDRIKKAVWALKPFRTDLQAIVTALGRRKVAQDRLGSRLDLRGANLRKADLSRGRFEGADLRKAHLEGANLGRAHLEGAYLMNAHLEGADLMNAHFEGADLKGAHLEGANLWWAHLEGADLWWAHLEGANLYGAHLEGADLRRSDVTQDQLDAAFGDEWTEIPDPLTRPTRWTRAKAEDDAEPDGDGRPAT